VRFRLIAVLLVLLVVATGALYTFPASDFLFTPGHANPLADKVRVEGAMPAPGDVFYVDVFVRRETWLERLLPFTKPEGADTYPEHALLPSGTSEAERDRQNAIDMQESEKIASAVALKALGYDVKIEPVGLRVATVFSDGPAAGRLKPYDTIVAVDGKRVLTTDELRAEIGKRKPGESVELTVERNGKTMDVTVPTIASPETPPRPIVGIEVGQKANIELPIKVDIDLGDVGGPSAGLAFALDVMEELGRNVDRGYKVAATGELELDGHVVPIGGAAQKAIGARKAGVDVFLVPAGDNYTEARKYADGLRVVPVKNFRQALRALATLRPSA
jgi:PDZ domain-containing protein